MLCYIGANLQVIVLPLLLCLEVESGQPPQVLLAYGFVDCGASPDPLSVVVGGVGPPVGLHLYVTQNHVLDRGGKARNLM